MAYFALLWKARTIEKYRSNYEKEKINSMLAANAELPRRNISQKWKLFRYNSQKKIGRTFRKWCPEGSRVSNFFVYLTTDQTFANFLVKSVIGFVGGIVLTYFWFMFFVFQLSISLIHATIMSSFIGVLLTLGLAFSYRIRCLVFLLIPQFFSRVGRYTLTCYALVLILTGPATNTLKNSEVLSESLACGQEQVRLNVNKISEAIDKPLQLLKDTINSTMKRIKSLAAKVKEVMVDTHRVIMSIAHVLQSSLAWLTSVEAICNSELGTPYEHCARVLSQGNQDFKKLPRKKRNIDYLIQAVCINVKPDAMCVVGDFASASIVATVKKKLENYSERIKSLLSLTLRAKRSHACYSNASRSASQAAAGIVTEIRHRADPLLTWLSWSSYLTSLFLMLIIFRAKYYQQMFETRSRFDNRYVTKEFRDLDFIRLRQGRETVLPLNTRERAKYVSTSSFRLLASERVHLTRSIVFMVITSFKLSIHMVADYSLYWVLMNMRFHGRFQALTQPLDPAASILVSGSGPLAGLLRGLLEALSIPLTLPAHSPITCLPNPLPPDFQRYAQIGVLILLLWVFALFEPYGLRLRHVIMSHYQPERARARAEWLYNHIIRTRGCFLKYARRKLHREYKYSTEQRHTFRNWWNNVIPCQWLRCLLGVGPEEPRCLLCSIRHIDKDPDTYLKRCESPRCPGVYCTRCFMDIGQLCTICLSPKDYGDLSDMSLENSSEENDDDDFDNNHKDLNKPLLKQTFSGLERDEGASTSQKKFTKKGFQVFSRTKNKNNQESMPLLNSYNFKRRNDCVSTQPLKTHTEVEQHDDDKASKNICVLTQPLKRRPEIEQYENDDRATSYIVQSKEIFNEPKIPVIVRDNKRLLKFVDLPKEKLAAIRNTMTLVTTKLEDDKLNKEWNTHNSKTFEYLVMEFFQPVDIFNKALFVRHTKYADSRLSLNNDEKIDSLKEVMDFLCSYQMNDVSSNNDGNDKTNTTLHPNTLADTTNIPSINNDGNGEKFTAFERISNRNMRNIRFFFHFKQTVPGDLFIRLNRRRVFFHPDKYITKKLNRNALNRMYGSIVGKTKRLEYKRSKHNQGPSFQDLSKCRIYKINKETFAKNLRIKLKKISLQKKNVTRETNYLALEKKLAEQMQNCPSPNGGPPICSNSNVLTECSSDINPSDLKYLPHSVKETHEIKTNESSDKNIPTTNDNNVIGDRKLLKIGGYCSCIWKRTKLTLKPRKLENSSKNKEPCANNKANHKRKKKIRMTAKDTRNKAKLNAKRVNDDARNYRMSLFLKEHDWLGNQLDEDMLNENKNLEKSKVGIKITKLEHRLKLKEENYLKKAAKKQLTRQLKLKLKAEQKLKKESMKKKHDNSRSLKTEGISFKDTPKADTKSKEKSSIEASACFARKLIRSVTREIGSRNKLKKVASRRHLPSYLNFYGFTCPALADNRESSLDLDEIFEPSWDVDFGETKVYYQEDSNRLCEEFFWPYCRKADDTTQTCEERKNNEKNTTVPESEEWVKEILNPKAISMRTVASDLLIGLKKSVEKIRNFQAPQFPQKLYAEKEVSAAPVMRTCSCQNVSINKKSKQSQAQVNLNHCGTQYEYEPMMNVLFTTNLNKPVEKEQTCAFCTCAVQSTFAKKEDVVKIDVGTMHFNASKKMQHASAQWQLQFTPIKAVEETNVTDSTLSISDDSKTDTTICSWLNYSIAYEHPKTPKAAKVKAAAAPAPVKVTKMTNQSTSTRRVKCTNVSTTTVDWWSPLVERKKKRKLKEVSKKDDGDKQSIGVETDGKYVSFRSYTQIIPAEYVDIMSPSRYLLESQKYYNEMFVPHVKQKNRDQWLFDPEKPNPGIGFFRPRKVNKTKRLEESYVPRKKTQTSSMNINPLSWRPAKEEVSSHKVKHHQRRNAKLQAGLKSKNNNENISKGVGMLGIHIKKNERVKPSKSGIVNGRGSLAGECESTTSY